MASVGRLVPFSHPCTTHRKEHTERKTMKNQVDREFTRNRGKHIAKQFYNTQGWYQEYLDSGAQYRMTFTEFKARKRKQLKRSRRRV